VILTFDRSSQTLRTTISSRQWRQSVIYLKRDLQATGEIEGSEILVTLPALPAIVSRIQRRFPELVVDPSVEREMARFKDAASLRRAARACATDTDFWMENGYPLKPPLAHQVAGIAWLATEYGAILGDDMGLGKTYQAINAASCVMRHDDATRVVVLCPNSVKENWRREVAMFGWGETERSGYRKALVPRARPLATKGAEELIRWADDGWKQCRWLILNYESLRHFPDAFHRCTDGAILVCDEAHRLKNARAKQSEIVQAAPRSHIWLMTGTLVANQLDDVWHPCHLVKPGLLYWNYHQFAHRHVERDEYSKVIGYKNPEVVQNRIEVVMVGRKKEQCLDLPEKMFTTRVVQLAADERRAYEQMRKDLIAWFDEVSSEEKKTKATAANFAVRALRLRQISAGLISDGETMNFAKRPTKANEVLALHEDSGRRRMVVWCVYVPVTKRIAAMFEKEGTWARALSGSVPQRERQDIVDEWSTTEGAVLVCQMDAMGEGWNGQAADLQAFIDVPFTPKQRLQCIDRLHRYGQTRGVEVVDIIAEDTLDDPLTDRLMRKIEVADETVSLAYERVSMDEVRSWLAPRK